LDHIQLNQNGPVPIYEQIKSWIQGQIVSGAWPEQYKLLAEADLASELDVSRGTVRKAIAELTEEGMLVRTHGRGTFVAPGALEQPLADRLITFSEDLISRGIAFETDVLAQGVAPATGRLAGRLNVRPGEKLFYLKRLRLVNDSPIIMLHNYVVYDVCPGIEAVDFAHVRLFEVLEQHYGLQIDHGRRTFQAMAAEYDTAEHLDLNAGDPIMHIEQQTYLKNNQLIEFSDLWLRGDQFKLSSQVWRTGTNETGLDVALLHSGLQ
jgi:DNA-binding GntR family transcriptional regulator